MSEARRAVEDGAQGPLPDFARLFDRAAHIVSVHRGAEHTYVYTNPAGRERIGRDPTGEPFAEVWPHLVTLGFAEHYDAVFESGEAEVFPPCGVRPAEDPQGVRAPRWVRHAVQPWLDENGEVAGVISTVEDVTEAQEEHEGAAATALQRDLGFSLGGIAGGWEYRPQEGTTLLHQRVAALFGVEDWQPGRPVSTDRFWRRVHPDDAERVRRTIDQAEAEEDELDVSYRIVSAKGGVRTVRSMARILRDAKGEATSLQGVSVDVTEAEAGAAELTRLAAENRVFRALAESSPDFIGIADQDLVSIFVNPAGRALVGRSEEEAASTPVIDYFVREERAFIEDVVLPAVEAEGRWEGSLHMIDVATGGSVPILYSHFKVTDPETGEATHHATISRDLTEQQQAEAHRQLLIDELNHRVKNTMAVVQAIASQTFRDVPAAAAAVDKFRGRLSALSGAHEVLTVERWQTADLRRTVVRALDGCGVPAERVTLGGPNASLPGKLAVSLAMAVHELCTNASKYGALSTDDGDISLGWAIEDDAPDRLQIVWRERGGPRIDAPPERTGFGMLMIERSLAAEAKGEVRMDWAPQGLTCTISVTIQTSPSDEDDR